MSAYQALLVVSFGGPEGPDDVIPFLENVLRGKPVPRERMLEVADHYARFGGVSPINGQNRALIAALEAELALHGPQLPIYWGNRNWRPFLPQALRQMANDGVRRALAFFTSAYSSYSGCRQYRENIAAAQAEINSEGLVAPQIDKLRVFFNHPGFVDPMGRSVREAMAKIPFAEEPCKVLFTAHSIPLSMAANCLYEQQLLDACRLVAARADAVDWELVYQSRSGSPHQPWLEPDVCDRIRQLHAEEALDRVVLAPIGFISDHLEVLYDLDTEARGLCDQLGIASERAATVGTDPAFVRMIRELVMERISGTSERIALGTLGASHDVCPSDCCLKPR